MALNLYNLKPAKGSKKSKKRVGRGSSSGHGTYSTRGLKGQRSRSGGKGGLKVKAFKANIQSIPKLGGFTSLRAKLAVVNLKDLEKHFNDKDLITVNILFQKGLIKSKLPGVKVLGMGKISKKLTLKVHKISESAKEAIEKAGGEVILIGKKDKKTDKAEEGQDKKTKQT